MRLPARIATPAQKIQCQRHDPDQVGVRQVIGALAAALMRLSLGTLALLWSLANNAQLSAMVRLWLGDDGYQVLVSIVSAWEIATKQRLGKLQGIAPLAHGYSDLVAADGLLHLPVTHAHALRAGACAVDHRDPFDRMLAAQAELESLPLLTCDEALAAFAGKTVW